MSNCRIARRIASIGLLNNRCAQGVSTPTLATKVLHLLFQSFPRGGGLAADAEHSALASETLDRVRLAGVRLCLSCGGACRLAWRGASSATLLIPSPLATNEGGSEAAG
jgi:hypothetical protein